jgi:hypothetical protein
LQWPRWNQTTMKSWTVRMLVSAATCAQGWV